MPLQIRRGTNAERLAMAQPLAQGELLYVTNDQRLYVGDGATLGGIQITGYTNEDAVDAVGAALVAGSNTGGISFTYGTTQDTANRIDATIDLSSYTGIINASALKGTLVGDDSTILIDGIANKINLDGTVKGNIIPDANEAYDIGSSSRKFKDLYLKGTSIFLGNATITNPSSTIINLPAGSTIGGVAIGDAIKGGTINGTFVGDVNGSIFADNSSLLVDAVTGSFRTSSMSISDGRISTDASTQLVLSSGAVGGQPIEILMAGGSGDSPTLTILSSLGTTISPTSHAAGDEISTMQFSGHLDSQYKEAVSITSTWGASADPTSSTPDSVLTIATRNNIDGFNVLSFNEIGVLTVPIFQATGYATGDLPTATGAPEEGYIVFDSSTKEFKGWNGSAWVVLG